MPEDQQIQTWQLTNRFGSKGTRSYDNTLYNCLGIAVTVFLFIWLSEICNCLATLSYLSGSNLLGSGQYCGFLWRRHIGVTISDSLGIVRLAVSMLVPEVRSCLLEKKSMFEICGYSHRCGWYLTIHTQVWMVYTLTEHLLSHKNYLSYSKNLTDYSGVSQSKHFSASTCGKALP